MFYLLVYSDRKDDMNDKSKHGKYAGIDRDSGGYPYATAYFPSANLWKELDEARSYKRMFPFLDIYEVDITLTKEESDV